MRDMYQKLVCVCVRKKCACCICVRRFLLRSFCFSHPLPTENPNGKREAGYLANVKLKRCSCSVCPLCVSAVIFHTFTVLDATHYMRPFIIQLHYKFSTCLSTHFCWNPFQINSLRVDKMEFYTLPLVNITPIKHTLPSNVSRFSLVKVTMLMFISSRIWNNARKA